MEPPNTVTFESGIACLGENPWNSGRRVKSREFFFRKSGLGRSQKVDEGNLVVNIHSNYICVVEKVGSIKLQNGKVCAPVAELGAFKFIAGAFQCK